jgi:hypothetical protein
MPALSKSIEGCGYHPAGDSLGFHFEDMSVLIKGRRVTAVGADSEAKARLLVEWLVGRLEVTPRAGERKEKQRS